MNAATTLPMLLDKDPNDTALIIAETGSKLTFDDLAQAVHRAAGLLASAGIQRGDRVALILADAPTLFVSLLGVAALGATAAPLNPAYTRDEFLFYLGDLEPSHALITGGDLQAARAAATSSIQIIDVLDDAAGNPALFSEGRALERVSSFQEARPGDVALLLHTSGTTSRPKQVPLLHQNLTASAVSIANHYALEPTDVSYSAMPLFHVHGLVASNLATFVAGGIVVVPQRFAPRRFWQHARQFGVTWLSAAPTLHHMILDRSDDSGPPATLRFVRSCSSPLRPSLMQRAEASYAAPMLEAYGMTEASHQISSNPLPPGIRHENSVGLPTGTAIRIVDSNGNDVPPGSAGEVVIEGPGVMGGYLNNEDANRESFFDGWFRTGDHGLLNDGYLYLQGRLKEMIIRGGENISPYEIEDVLLLHRAVREAVCFAVPDDKYGETVGAVVTLDDDASQAELVSHCRERLAAFKVPTVIHVVETIPRTATGKLQRRRMLDLLSADL